MVQFLHRLLVQVNNQLLLHIMPSLMKKLGKYYIILMNVYLVFSELI